MYPELFKIPFTELTVKSYGTMLVLGFLAAIAIIRRLSRNFTTDQNHITNAALYALIAGVVGARLFFVVHYFKEKFSGGNLWSIFAVWQGGLEQLGGAIFAIAVIIFYMYRHRLPIRRYLDVLAVGLLIALAFGRMGCFLNGCCFGKPTNLPWAVRFPYKSPAYESQIYPDKERNRAEPRLAIPLDFFGFTDEAGNWQVGLKPYKMLSEFQKSEVQKGGPYQCLAVHPTQIYSSLLALMGSGMLYLFWRRSQRAQDLKVSKWFTKQGSTFALVFILYGIARFCLEFIRDDNPFEFDGLTVSQNLSIILVVIGIVLMVVFSLMKQEETSLRGKAK